MSAEEPEPQVLSAAALAELSSLAEEVLAFLEDMGEWRGRFSDRLSGFFEKLVVLSAGTLTLIVGVVSSLSTRLAQLHSIAVRETCLLIACWLFIATIVCSVAHNLCSNGSVANSQLAAKIFKFQYSISKMQKSLNGKGVKLTPLDHAKLDVEGKRLAAGRGERLARLFGVCAILCVVGAFVLLMIFLQANLIVLLDGRAH